MTDVTDVLNNLLHEQAKGFLKRYKGHPETLSEMSLDNIVASIHPVLWNLTQSKRQRQHRSLSHDERTVYALCVLLFTINHQCCVPLHLPLTDLHGGTTELVTILNRFAAVASADTHSIFLQDLSADCKVMLDCNLTQNAFPTVSVDNIDLLQSHTQVYATDSHRSYFGASVQCVEPMPTTCYECTSLCNQHRKTSACPYTQQVSISTDGMT